MTLDRLAPPAGAHIIVVGGCGGIGRALVGSLLEIGCTVAVLDLPASLAAHPPPDEVLTVPFDGREEHLVNGAFAAVRDHWHSADGLVILSGFTTTPQPVEALESALFDEVIAGNLRLTALCAREGLRLLRAAGAGAMVTMATDMSFDPRPGYGAYVSAKAGIVALTATLAREAGPEVRVNCVAPSAVDTAFMRGGTGRSAEDEAPRLIDLDAYAKTIPLGRIATPEDIIGPILFLLGEGSRYISGQAIRINGGLR